MKVSLKIKLAFSYALVALVLVAAISLFSNRLLKSQFEKYVVSQQNSRIEAILSQIRQEFNADAGSFRLSSLEVIGVTALENGMIIKVIDSGGTVLWNAWEHNNGFCNEMLEAMASNMQRHYQDFDGAYTEKDYPVTVDNATVGTVSIGYYGPFYFSENDTAFIDALNSALLVIGALALLGAVPFGFFMARRISRPIERTTEAAAKIAKGDYLHRVEEQTGTRELFDLTTSINSLSLALQTQDTIRKNMTADIAHELRTPLANLQGNLEAILDGVWQPDAVRLQSLHEEVVRLTKLVGNLESLARLESEPAALEKSVFDMTALAKRAAVGFESDCAAKMISLTVKGDEQLICADRDKMLQVLINLISNSLRYTPQGGRIEIGVNGDENGVTIVVEDNGAGIDAQHLPLLFERFYRADLSRSSQSGGAGIGLAIVKAIVDRHGGRVEVTSEPNVSTRFTVYLPRS